MKKTSSPLFAAIALCSPLASEAASISVSNISDGFSGTSFVLKSGPETSVIGQLFSGFIAIFEFLTAQVPSTAVELKNNDTEGFLGLTELNAGNRPAAGAVFASLNIEFTNIDDLYIVVGDNTSVADASALALVKASDLTFLSGGGGADTLGTYELNKAADVKIGTVGSGTFDYSAFGIPEYDSFSLTLAPIIPEPASALFLGISLLAVAGIRRRK
jgi:hypothetical protein